MITGNPNPIVGKEEFYQYQNQYQNPLDLFNSAQSIFVWFIWKKQKNGTWVNITTNPPKMGQRVPFTFGQKVIGQEFMLEVFQSHPISIKNFKPTSVGKIFLIPAASLKAKINKVILFNQGTKNPNKASYSDTLVARAYCIGMFNQEVEFRLWEDDASGGGHNATINKKKSTSTGF